MRGISKGGGQDGGAGGHSWTGGGCERAGVAMLLGEEGGGVGEQGAPPPASISKGLLWQQGGTIRGCPPHVELAQRGSSSSSSSKGKGKSNCSSRSKDSKGKGKGKSSSNSSNRRLEAKLRQQRCKLLSLLAVVLLCISAY
mmetsp:Transcript_16314/g.44714  ORF Transcript_16314/g.44714 Transcript_16314/m.44714 type:complete len:141 (+) Transcript_16314:2164-2586(+)